MIVAAAAAGVWMLEGRWSPAAFVDQKLLSTLRIVRHTFERNERASTPNLVFENTKASIDRPLPLGISLNNGLGGETLILSGLAEGTSLSAGSALSRTRWSLPAHDLEKAFISAPENFEGVMEVTVTLYSSSEDVLETRQARFYWDGSGKGDKLPATSLPLQNPGR